MVLKIRDRSRLSHGEIVLVTNDDDILGIWNKRPDGFTIKMPTTETVSELVILEFKRVSCVTDQYVKRASNQNYCDLMVALTTLTYIGTDRTYQRDSIVGCIT